MPCNSKCGFCGIRGHQISHCHSEEGTQLFNHIRSRAIDYIVLERQSIQQRAILFHKFLIDNCYVKELKLLLSKIQCSPNGNSVQLAARFVNNYFIINLGFEQFPDSIDENDRRDITGYLTFWRNLSIGREIHEVNLELSRYFGANNRLNTHKFNFKIDLKSIELTEENAPHCFECAICMEEECSIFDKVELGCNHSFCTICVSAILSNSQIKKIHPSCALCRKNFENMHVHRNKIMEDYRQFC